MEYPEFDNGARNLKITLSESISLPEAIVWLNNANVTDSKILLSEANLNEVERNFPLNSRLVELIEQNQLAVYASETTDLPTAILGEESVRYMIGIGNVDRFVEISETTVRNAFTEEFDRLVDSATLVELDIPPWNEILTQLEETVDAATREEFERLIRAAQIEDLGALDEASVALIAAAQSGALLYDLGKWGEDVGLASKATFSRRKTSLEEQGVIYTEKVPVDVGRPRDRLKLADDLSGIDVDIGVEDAELGISTSRFSEAESEKEGQSTSTGSDTDQTDEPDIEEGSDILSTIEKEIQNAIQSSR